MSEECPVYFPTKNTGMDDLHHSRNLLVCAVAAISAMQDHHVPVDLDSLRYLLDDSLAYLEGAVPWAERLDREETDIAYGRLVPTQQAKGK
ncbi:hypothetical protein KHC23_12360 [Ancylobacter dichloromethanicus]|uniref:Uncharacterized protein n=1 Tax=Ancylobacter dichloromethanicus TaxID=518825 RepID=A0A9W6MZ29_9HYPH|nr:hypothetical protein [Ancylobacter dichloromethanicus]MBS7554447.1 hypothetical protein [Ancylobacter dichloromethanicus]GLK71575.1 hypothetical protein GCM10017643_16900 [Ancylobacter dichloromethanicus]